MYLLYKRIYNIHLPIDLQLKLNILKYKQLLCHENVAILKQNVFICLTYNKNCLLIKTLLQ